MSPDFTLAVLAVTVPLAPWETTLAAIVMIAVALRLLYFALLPDPEEPRVVSRLLAAAIALACIAGVVVKIIYFGWM